MVSRVITARTLPTHPLVLASLLALVAIAAPGAQAQQSFKDLRDSEAFRPPPEIGPLTYSPWMKACSESQGPAAEQFCFTSRDARAEAGFPVAAVIWIEIKGSPKKVLRIVMPSPLQLRYGTRVIVDQQSPLSMPLVICFGEDCLADYEGTSDLIEKLKRGQTLIIQAINVRGDVISFRLPLADFAEVNEGPPTDPRMLDEQQRVSRAKIERQFLELREPKPQGSR